MKLLDFIFVLLVGFSTFIDGYRILGIFPRNSPGDFIAFEHLMKSLADRGHEVNVISFFPLRKTHPNYYDIVQFPDAMPSLINNVTYHNIGTKMKYLLNSIETEYGNDVCNLLGHPNVQNILQNPPKDIPYGLVITEMFIANCFFVFGDMLRVPVVGVSTYGRLPWVYDIINNPEGLDFVPQKSSDANYISFMDRWANVISQVYTKYSFYQRTYAQDAILKKHIGKDTRSVRELESSVALVLTNSHVLTHGPRPIIPGLVEVGGMHIVDKYVPPLYEDIKKWLDESKNGVIYFNLGTDFKVDSFPTETVDALYKSFGKLAPMRVLMRLEKFENLPQGLPQNVLTVSWVQQLRVLAHPNVKAFITHGGIMGLQEAIYAAVPIIGIPLWGDQFDNIDVFVKKNIGVKLKYDGITEETLEIALKSILNNSTIKEAASAFSLAFFDRPATPIDTACHSIEYIIKHGAEVLKLPPAQLTWWQYFNLDVIIISIVVLSITVVSMVMVVHKIAIKTMSRFHRKPKYHKLL